MEMIIENMQVHTFLYLTVTIFIVENNDKKVKKISLGYPARWLVKIQSGV